MADNGADFMRSMSIATSGLRAQAGRMRIISENIANAELTASRLAAILTAAQSDVLVDKSIARWTRKWSSSAECDRYVRLPRPARAGQSHGRRQGRRQIPQRQCAGGDNRLSRRTALL